jgi:hypothetical protein
MTKTRKWLRRGLWSGAVLGAYPLWVLMFTWSHVWGSDLPGGRHGPLDAYRHALASATVSYTLGEWAVHLVSTVFEGRGKDSNRMDIHNNRIGAVVGAQAHSFDELEPAVRQAVQQGQMSATDPLQITWLTEERWGKASLW